MADGKQAIYNHDVAGLYARLQRFMSELIGSSSGSVSLMNAFDQARLLTYLVAVETYQAWVNSAPQLDLPETNRTLWDLKAAVVIPDIENESTVDVLRLLRLCSEELIGSQSARMPSGLIKFDSDRLSSYIAKAKLFLATYIQKADPLDLPESSPQSPVAPAGKQGV